MSYPVIISYSNNGYYDFAKNMLLNLNNKIKFHKIHFYCLDDEIYENLTKLNLPNIQVTFERWTTPNISKQFETYGTHEYNLITHTKVQILRDALIKYNFIHFIDCDVVCIHEPTIEHYSKYVKYDIVFQHDAGMHSAEHLHAPTLHHIWACTGNTTLRNTPETAYILYKIDEYQGRNKNLNDQECLYEYFKDISINDLRSYNYAKLYTYNIDEYTNGYWLKNNIGTLEHTYFFHANHVSGKTEKFKLLMMANEYYL
jgi:hypothetical protein